MSKTLVFTFGRFAFPTKGHVAHIKSIKQYASDIGADYQICCSTSMSLLPVEQRQQWLEKATGELNITGANNPFVFMDSISNGQYNKIIIAAGGDYFIGPKQHALFSAMRQYASDHKVELAVMSTGHRMANISGTAIKAAALANDFDTFKSIAPDLPDEDITEMFDVCKQQ